MQPVPAGDLRVKHIGTVISVKHSTDEVFFHGVLMGMTSEQTTPEGGHVVGLCIGGGGDPIFFDATTTVTLHDISIIGVRPSSSL